MSEFTEPEPIEKENQEIEKNEDEIIVKNRHGNHDHSAEPDPDADIDPEKVIAEIKEKLCTDELDLETKKYTLVRLRKFLIKNSKLLLFYLLCSNSIHLLD
jgi:hypothetical protein